MTELEARFEYKREIAILLTERRNLEKQLQNAIVPKFKVGQTAWCHSERDTAIAFVIDEIFIHVNAQGYSIYYQQQGFLEVSEAFAFATREEAEKALAERGVK